MFKWLENWIRRIVREEIAKQPAGSKIDADAFRRGMQAGRSR
ncbi:MAG TPA: hypothetical protein VGK74_02260 [Symbiobacteriaceae bacterium]